MLEVFGWLVLVVIGLQASVAWFFLGLCNTMGQYNIGGVPNKTSTKLTAGVIGLLIALYFYWLYTICPFTVTLS